MRNILHRLGIAGVLVVGCVTLKVLVDDDDIDTETRLHKRIKVRKLVHMGYDQVFWVYSLVYLR